MSFRSRPLLVLAAAAMASVGWVGAGVAEAQPSAGSAQVRVGTTTYQRVDGFGFADAFGQVGNLEAMPASVQSAVTNLLFSPTTGAGLDIVRFGLGASAAGGGAGNLSDQEWLGQQAEKYGVHTFYGDAWSAPGELKTNGSQDNGGYLCGVPGESCAAGDFRQAYADYLAAEAAAFAQAGMPLLAVDFVNEPEIGPGYASMLMTPAQAADFVPHLGRALQAAGLSTTVACCDAEGWANSTGFDGAQAYTEAVLSNPQSARYVGLITSHGYTSAPTFPLTNERPVWETEWSTFESWDPAWNDGTDASGLSWADRIYTALTSADVNAFLYWWGTTTYKENGDNEGLVILGTPTDTTADSYQASGRLWAFAAFSRFVRPGAVRLETTTSAGSGGSPSGLDAVAFFVPDHPAPTPPVGPAGTASPPPAPRSGHYVVVAVNNGTSSQEVQVSLPMDNFSGSAQPYLTDSNDNGAAQRPIAVSSGSFSATVPAGSVVSFVITRSGESIGGPRTASRSPR
jgi:glucuronoarabinoxylan endo-1,4-beta-xylanase